MGDSLQREKYPNLVYSKDTGKVSLCRPSEQRKYKVKDAAGELGVGEKTMRRIIEDREIAAVKVRGSIFILQDDLDDFILQNRQPVGDGESNLLRRRKVRKSDAEATGHLDGVDWA